MSERLLNGINEALEFARVELNEALEFARVELNESRELPVS